MKLQLPLAPENRLVRWANAIRAFYGHPIYLVGSQITAKANPRDVDVVCVIPDDEFCLRYGPVEKWQSEGESGFYSFVRWSWSDDCVKKSLHGMKETGLSIDFKVQAQSIWDGYENIRKAFPPYKLDTRE